MKGRKQPYVQRRASNIGIVIVGSEDRCALVAAATPAAAALPIVWQSAARHGGAHPRQHDDNEHADRDSNPEHVKSPCAERAGDTLKMGLLRLSFNAVPPRGRKLGRQYGARWHFSGLGIARVSPFRTYMIAMTLSSEIRP